MRRLLLLKRQRQFTTIAHHLFQSYKTVWKNSVSIWYLILWWDETSLVHFLRTEHMITD